MTDAIRPLNTAIDRPSPEIIKAYATLSPNELSETTGSTAIDPPSRRR